jgi:hypothetical protein
MYATRIAHRYPPNTGSGLSILNVEFNLGIYVTKVVEIELLIKQQGVCGPCYSREIPTATTARVVSRTEREGDDCRKGILDVRRK